MLVVILCFFRSAEREDPILIDEDEEEATLIAGPGIAFLPSEVADRSATSYEGRRYVFTLNNPATNSPKWGGVSDFGVWLFNILGLSFIIWSYEKGASGTKHFQGYLELSKKSHLQSIKNKFKAFGAWVAPAKGTAQQSIEYISHTGKWIGKQGLIAGAWEKGQPAKLAQGTRTDLKLLADDIKKGHDLKKIAEDHTATLLKCCSNAKQLISLLNKKKRSWMTELYIYTGNLELKNDMK